LSLAIGIDLGTTNSVGAFKFAGLEIVTAADNTPPDRVLTPSVVAYQADGPRVGHEALAQHVAAPERVVVSVKRLMGRGCGDPAVQAYSRRFGRLSVSAPEGGTVQGLALRLGAEQVTPEDVSAAILSKVPANARSYLAGLGRPGVAIDRAVITVPAYFNDKQRHATLVAGARAGLTRVELLPEPTAAAISFAHDAGDAQTILVYDFGGGTFDASLITAAGNTFVECAKAGDLWLGGNDLDLALEGHVLAELGRAEGISDIAGLVARLPDTYRRRFQADLRQALEQAKIALSRWERTMVSPATPLLDEHGLPLLIEVPLTRAELDRLVAGLVDRTVDICRRMLAEAAFPLDTIDRVLLVGGSSQLAIVQRRTREAFGDRVVVHPRPMTAVAEGAALVAAGLVEKIGTVSRDYYIRLADAPRHCVIPRNEILPYRASQTFVTVVDGQRMLRLRFFNQDHVAGLDEPIGDVWLGLDRAYPKGTEVLAMFELDETSNVLQVTACLKRHPEVKVSRTFSRGLADEAFYEEVEAAIARLNDGSFTQRGVEEGLNQAAEIIQHVNGLLDERTAAVRPAALAATRQSLARLQRLVSPLILEARWEAYQLRRVSEVCGTLLPSSARGELDTLVIQLEKALGEGEEGHLHGLVEQARRKHCVWPPEVDRVLEGLRHLDKVRHLRPLEAAQQAPWLDRLVTALKQGQHAEAEVALDHLRRAAEGLSWQAAAAAPIVLEPGRHRG